MYARVRVFSNLHYLVTVGQRKSVRVKDSQFFLEIAKFIQSYILYSPSKF